MVNLLMKLCNLCDEDVLHLLNCYYIKPDDIILNDTLLKNKTKK